MSAYTDVLEDLRGECLYEATAPHNSAATQSAWNLVYLGAIEEYYRKGLIDLTRAKKLMKEWKKEVEKW